MGTKVSSSTRHIRLCVEKPVAKTLPGGRENSSFKLLHIAEVERMVWTVSQTPIGQQHYALPDHRSNGQVQLVNCALAIQDEEDGFAIDSRSGVLFCVRNGV